MALNSLDQHKISVQGQTILCPLGCYTDERQLWGPFSPHPQSERREWPFFK